jgi:hypothetical protein
MGRIVLFGALVGFSFWGGCAGNPEGERNIEAAEDLEESAGDEAELIGDNPNDMDGWDPPGGEIEAEMEAEPYPQ